MGHPGLALGCLDWPLGGCAACTEALVCTGISSCQSGSDGQLVYTSCPWAVDGQGLVWCPLSFFSVDGGVFLQLAWVLQS